MTTAGGPRQSTSGLTYRPARPDELATCEAIWRTSINDYIVPLGQGEIPVGSNQALRLFTHLQATDPDRFLVATEPDGTDERAVAFVSAVVRERLWYLSMLFVLPEAQGDGVGRELLARVWPTTDADETDRVRATATDSAQPISNALYALHDIVPRMPLFSLTGLPQRPEAFEPLPSGVVPLAFDEIAGGPPDSQGHRMLVDAVDGLDRELIGVAHPGRSSIPAQRIAPWLALSRAGRHAGRLRLRGRGRPARPDRGPRRSAPLPDPRPPDLDGRAARGIRDVGRRRRGPGDRPGPASRLPARPVPRPALLGPVVRRLLALPADLARPALTTEATPAKGPVRRGTVGRFAGPPPGW